MKPYRPPVLEFESEDHRHRLCLPMPPATPSLNWDRHTYSWPAISNPHPKRVIFNVPRQQVILLGGLGDPGISLGEVNIYSPQGDTLAELNLNQYIPELETLSANWKSYSNFPWLAKVELRADGQTLTLWICDRLKTEIDLQDFGIDIETYTNIPTPM